MATEICEYFDVYNVRQCPIAIDCRQAAWAARFWWCLSIKNGLNWLDQKH